MRVTHEEALNTHIDRLRKVRGVTQEELGRALGVSQATASRKLHGLIPFSAEEMARCADYFGVTVGNLYDVHLKSTSTTPKKDP